MTDATPGEVLRSLLKAGWKISSIAKNISVSQASLNSILKDDSTAKYKVFAALKGMIGTPPPARTRKISKPLVMRNALRDIAHAETLEDAVRLANDALRQV